MKKIILNSQLSILNLLLLCTVVNAQTAHEFSIYAGGGLSTLNYSVTTGEQKMGFGGQVGLAYQFFFSSNWGLSAGAEVALYQAKANLSNFSDSYQVQGATAANNYTYRFALNRYSETQQAFYINIPLMLQYQTGKAHKFYVAAGGKIGFPIKATAKTEDYSVSTQGYFSAEGRTYDDLPQYGFGTYTYTSGKTNLDFSLNLMAAVEAGVKWKIGAKNALYTGVYADYGFNNIQKTNNKIFVQSRLAAENPPMLPLVVSQYAGKPFTDKITPLAIGVKLRMAFGASGKTTVVETPNYVPLPPPVIPSTADNTETEKAETDRLAKEQETQRLAAEKARQEEVARKAAEESRIAEMRLITAQQTIQQPVEHYALSQAELTAQQKQKLDEKIALLQQYSDIKVFIYGHTCDIGSNAINEKTGLQRAEKAKDYLISKGIDAKRIVGTASKRDTEPLVPNNNEENRRVNRRVVIIIEN